jgi:hypothetical protein
LLLSRQICKFTSLQELNNPQQKELLPAQSNPLVGPQILVEQFALDGSNGSVAIEADWREAVGEHHEIELILHEQAVVTLVHDHRGKGIVGQQGGLCFLGKYCI